MFPVETKALGSPILLRFAQAYANVLMGLLLAAFIRDVALSALGRSCVLKSH